MNNFNFTNLIEYFNNPSFDDNFSLTERGNINFHWSNHRISKKRVSSYFKDKFFSTNLLWIKNEDSYVQFDTQAILEYITTKNHNKDVLDSLYEPKEISTSGVQGPFVSTTLMDCFTGQDIKRKFLQMSLKNKIPQRDFRLNCMGKVLMCFEKNFIRDIKINIHQINKTGILLKSNHESINEILEFEKKFKFYINSDEEKIVEDFYSEREIDSFVVDLDKLHLSYSVHSDETYIFIRYKDIPNKFFTDNFKQYLKIAEENIAKIAS